MTHTFETENNKKALAYTLVICAAIMLLFFLIRWKSLPPSENIVQDLIEINLGNNIDGMGEEQPLIKGKQTVNKEPDVSSLEKNNPTPIEALKTEENKDKDAAAIVNTRKKTSPLESENINKNKNKIAKITYTGPDKGKNGNDNNDNGYRYQGNNKTGLGDNGSPEGDKDSYGNTPGGKTGGPRIIKGNRKIIQHYKFEGDLNRATIYAIIKVSPNGTGRFIGFDKGSTDRTQAYANAVSNYLKKIQFDKSDLESQVTVEFVFDVN